MKQTDTNAQNTFTATAIKQNLSLWQTTRSLLDIDMRLDNALASEDDQPASTNGGLWPWIKKLFTYFGA